MSPILSDGFSRGPREKILVQDSVLSSLRRMHELERDGLSAKEARKCIVQELGKSDGKRLAKIDEGDGRLIEVLQEEIEHLRKENEWFRGRVDELTPLALPRPRRGWFAWMRPAKG